ncbi:ankyrin repeat domain-containing protein [Candidatus Cardinium hertigii]|uniref:Ankyrin repeat domain-containing protein n=1 Tax=Candidatus Cardinium hertigii TaxID=247481 RepID=A0A3N2QCI4_9BACT|nr:ankyrin repeat domain-containing protein [Candidatus Cardinium hertigii]ROT47490.1 ankyrin repeat domain-containing protein [Candidatus Cardinium hertigii]
MKTNIIKIKIEYYKQLLKSSIWMPLLFALSSCSQQSSYDLFGKSRGNTMKYEIKHSTSEAFEQSIKNTVNIGNVENKKDRLYIAVKLNDIEAVKIILDRISQDNDNQKALYQENFPNSINAHSKKTPLGKAIEMHHKEIVKLLVQHPDIDVYNTGEGLNALLLALHNKDREMAQIVFDNYILRRNKEIATEGQGHNVKHMLYVKDELDNTPLHLSIKYGYSTLAEALIARLPIECFYSKDKKGRNALHMAARYNKKKRLGQMFNKIKEEAGITTAVNKLLEKDGEERSVWACAYLAKPKHRLGSNAMFDAILKLTSNDLPDSHRATAIPQEIKTFYEKRNFFKKRKISDSQVKILYKHLGMKYRDYNNENASEINCQSSSNSHLTVNSTTSFTSENSHNELYDEHHDEHQSNGTAFSTDNSAAIQPLVPTDPNSISSNKCSKILGDAPKQQKGKLSLKENSNKCSKILGDAPKQQKGKLSLKENSNKCSKIFGDAPKQQTGEPSLEEQLKYNAGKLNNITLSYQHYQNDKSFVSSMDERNRKINNEQ